VAALEQHDCNSRLYDRGALRLEQMDAGVQETTMWCARSSMRAAPTTTSPRRCAKTLTASALSRRWPLRTRMRPPTNYSVPSRLGFAGAPINGHSRGRYLDDPAYEGLSELAETLGVAIYLHPTTPHPAVMDA
jgi:2,3-dihydroxybenzoate decarboxylase